MLGFWNFCTYDDEHLLYFSMTLYDVDNRGFLTPPECSSLVRMYYGSDVMNARVAEVACVASSSSRRLVSAACARMQVLNDPIVTAAKECIGLRARHPLRCAVAVRLADCYSLCAQRS